MLDFHITRDPHGCLVIGGHLIVRPQEVAEFVERVNAAIEHEPSDAGSES